MIRSEHQQRVDEFMVLTGQDVPATPVMPDGPTRVLRACLMLEEVLETVTKGLGVSVYPRSFGDSQIEHTDDLRLEADLEPNLVEAVDGCLDVKVVTTGTLTALGVADSEPQRLVDDNNLAKFGPGYRDAGGKWIKPPGHKPPDIAAELVRQGANLKKE